MERRLHDFYPTPLPLVKAGVQLLPAQAGDLRVLDPGCADGRWGQAVYDRFNTPGRHLSIHGIEIQPHTMSVVYDNLIWGDFLQYPKPRPEILFDLVVGNPPYSLALAFIERALSLTKKGGYVFFLLPVSTLFSLARFSFWFKHPPIRTWNIVPRPSFTGNGTAHDEYIFALWAKDSWGGTSSGWLCWKPEKAQGVPASF